MFIFLPPHQFLLLQLFPLSPTSSPSPPIPLSNPISPPTSYCSCYSIWGVYGCMNITAECSIPRLNCRKGSKSTQNMMKARKLFSKKYHRMYSSWWLPTQWMLLDSSKITSGVREALLLWLFITWNISIYWLLFSLHIFTDLVFDSLLLNQYAVRFACLKEGSKSTSETSFTLSSLTANDLWQNTVLLFHSSYTFTSILIDNPPPSSALKYFSKIFHLSNHLITVFHFVMGISTDDHFYFPCTFKACSKEPLLVPGPVNYNLGLSIMMTLYVLDRQNGEET